MKLTEYQIASAETAIYPESGTGSAQARTYAALGLVNEAGEVAGKVKKAIRDDGWRDGGDLSDERRQSILDECGDVLWYLAQLCSENGETFPAPVPDMDAPSQDALPQLAMGLSMHAVGMVAGDDYESGRPLVTVLDALCTLLGSDLESVAAANIAKLTSRAQRGTLGGDGDTR